MLAGLQLRLKNKQDAERLVEEASSIKRQANALEIATAPGLSEASKGSSSSTSEFVAAARASLRKAKASTARSGPEASIGSSIS